MSNYNEECKHHMLDQESEYGDSQPAQFEQALHRPTKSWWRANILSLAIILLLCYIAILETINIAMRRARVSCSGSSDKQLSKYVQHAHLFSSDLIFVLQVSYLRGHWSMRTRKSGLLSSIPGLYRRLQNWTMFGKTCYSVGQVQFLYPQETCPPNEY